MPTNTSKFNLVKPLKSEKYNVDVFNGNADIIDSQIYSKTEVDTALNGKANTTTTINNKALSSNIIINASDVPNTPAGNISATNVQNAINELDTEKVDKLMATNLITNGDFSNGTTGFQVSPGGTLTNVNNQGVVVFGAAGRALELVTPILATISDKIYLKFNAMTSGITTLRIRPDATTLLADLSLTSTLTNYSYVTTTATNSLPLRFILLTGDVNASVTFDNILAINLTTLFGAGNEPTKEQMDRLLSIYPNSWFNGTQEITNIKQVFNEKVDKLMATNLVTNGATQTFTGYANNVTTWGSIDLIQNSIYYIRRIGTLVSGTEVVGITGGIRSLSPSTFILIEGTNIQPTSRVFTFNQTTRLGVTLTAYGANPGTYTFDSVILINLTQLFGTGNEPTREQMDYLLSNFPNSWFNGTVELMNYRQLLDRVLELDTAKANRTQEAWITPTLLNGWTQVDAVNNPVGYYIDTLGRVWLRGLITGGTLLTAAFQVPVGYRPQRHVHYITFGGFTNNNTVGKVYSTTTGNISIGSSANVNISLDGISWRAV